MARKLVSDQPQSTVAPQKQGRFLGGAIPATGGILGGLLGGAAGGLAGIPALGVGAVPGAIIGGTAGAAAGTGGGFALEQSLEDLLGIQRETPQEQLEMAGKEVGLSAGAQLVGGSAGSLLSKLGRVVAGPFTKVGGVTPGRMQQSIGKLLKPIQQEIDELLEKNVDKVIDVKPIIAKVQQVRQTAINQGLQKATPAIDDAINRLQSIGPKATPKQLNDIRMGFGKETFGPTGKELSKTGKGVFEKAAKKTAGGEAREALVKEIDTLDDLFKQQRALTQRQKDLDNPIKGLFGITVPAGITAGAIAPFAPGLAGGIVTAGGLGGLLRAPYTNLLLRQGAQGSLGLTGTAAGPLAQLIARAIAAQQLQPQPNVQLNEPIALNSRSTLLN